MPLGTGVFKPVHFFRWKITGAAITAAMPSAKFS
jgi:hypothetical protein